MSTIKDPLNVGQVLAKTYRIVQLMSRGAFGSVYLAQRADDGLLVVAKALREDAGDADPTAVQRFIREAAAASMLDHPNIVRTLNFGRTRDGVLYIILERLYGQTLREAMFVERVDPAVVAEVARQMLSALAYAHKMGIVHRDLKPSNVFVSHPEHRSAYGNIEGNLVKLLDFGFVKVLNQPDNAIFNRQLTVAGTVVGTPGYIAPELLRPDTETPVTPAVDLYAVGVLAYELLTARQAFPGEGVARAVKQLNSDPDPPEPELRELPIAKIIMKLLARQVENRYQSANDALTDLADVPII